jgi:hypothetical protein
MQPIVQPLTGKKAQHDRNRESDAELGSYSQGLDGGDRWPSAMRHSIALPQP